MDLGGVNFWPYLYRGGGEILAIFEQICLILYERYTIFAILGMVGVKFWPLLYEGVKTEKNVCGVSKRNCLVCGVLKNKKFVCEISLENAIFVYAVLKMPFLE